MKSEHKPECKYPEEAISPKLTHKVMEKALETTETFNKPVITMEKRAQLTNPLTRFSAVVETESISCQVAKSVQL